MIDVNRSYQLGTMREDVHYKDPRRHIFGLEAVRNDALREAVVIVKSYLEDDGVSFYGSLQTIWESIESEVTP